VRSPELPETQGKYGLASLVCGGASVLCIVFSVVPFVGCLGMPLGVLSALGAVVLGVMAIVDGGRRGDGVERTRGIAGIALGVLPACLLGAGLAFFSRSMLRDAIGSTPTAYPAAVDAGAPRGK